MDDTLVWIIKMVGAIAGVVAVHLFWRDAPLQNKSSTLKRMDRPMAHPLSMKGGPSHPKQMEVHDATTPSTVNV